MRLERRMLSLVVVLECEAGIASLWPVSMVEG